MATVIARGADHQPAEAQRQPRRRGPDEGVRIRAAVPGSTAARVEALPLSGRRVVTVRIDPSHRRGALSEADSVTLAEAARLAVDQRLPFVVVMASSGADVFEGVASLHGWGQAAKAITRCSGIVPVVFVCVGFALSGPALLLGLADLVVMTPDAVAYVSGPAAVAQLTGQVVTPTGLGGEGVHSRSTGLAALHAEDTDDAFELVDEVLGYLPSHADEPPPEGPEGDPLDRPAPELRDLLPASATGSYDVRDLLRAIADDGEILELRAHWAPQLVTALTRIGGQSVGVIANQPQVMAGTLDIAAAQKGARWVELCDAFNVPLLTVVDTPGFMPGRDLEWRGMIRHGAQLVSAYANAQVPRVSLILRKAYGGAYIVMDSKGMASDICLAWPSAQVAVMGAEPAVQILHRREDPATQAKLAEQYEIDYLNPYVAAARGYIDQVIDPAETRSAVGRALAMLNGKRERLVPRKHGNGPL
ncbi:MAG TPA: carboxyl transferase domain-containing protein [Acidimicrobiales bacterium]|nr:carboxyl transferase domain-containing protein [Acidimicrobiales bacterium]